MAERSLQQLLPQQRPAAKLGQQPHATLIRTVQIALHDPVQLRNMAFVRVTLRDRQIVLSDEFKHFKRHLIELFGRI